MKEQAPSAIDFALENFLPYRLSLLSNTVSEGISRAYHNEHGLSVTEWRIIAVLGRFPGLIANEVVERTMMDKVAVSRAVKSLSAKGFVERVPCDKDRRRMPLKLTARKGMPLFRRVVPRAMDYEHRLLSALSTEETAELSRLLAKLQLAAGELNQRLP